MKPSTIPNRLLKRLSLAPIYLIVILLVICGIMSIQMPFLIVYGLFYLLYFSIYWLPVAIVWFALVRVIDYILIEQHKMRPGGNIRSSQSKAFFILLGVVICIGLSLAGFYY